MQLQPLLRLGRQPRMQSVIGLPVPLMLRPNKRWFHASVCVNARLRAAAASLSTHLASPTLMAPSSAPDTSASTNTSTQRNSDSEEDEALLIESLPAGVTLPFYRPYLALRDALDAPSTPNTTTPALLATGLRALAHQTATRADATLLADALARWHKHPRALPHDAADNALLARAVAGSGAWDVLLGLALNPHRYGVYLPRGVIAEGMAHFAREVVQATEGESVEAPLDHLYMAFALLVSMHVEPGVEAYTPLVVAGAYGPSGAESEAWKRAIVSYREALFLGLQFPRDVHDAVVAKWIQLGEFKKAVGVVEAQRGNVHPRLVVEAHLMNGELVKAVGALSVSLKEEVGSAAERWTPTEQVYAILLAELEEKDKGLFTKASEMIGGTKQ
ncbi:hypothetical protein BC830DRAFT_1119770 [Chytriomyces sp. MP71]|nr:hypothetical protein BC830DRAFT_1119770 [Chytriomyces sp. MP71]